MDNLSDSLASTRRFVPGITTKNRIELDFFNLYGWLFGYVADKKVLDAASGSGLGSFILAQKASEVLGIDFSEEAVKFAKEHYEGGNLNFLQGDLLNIDLPVNYFDIVVSSMTIEQIDKVNHKVFLCKLNTALKKEGILFLITPNKRVTSPGVKTPPFHWNKVELTKKELENLLSESGFGKIQWFGRRLVATFIANRFFKLFFNGIQKITGRPHGFYSTRESPVVKKINFFWQPKDFVIMATKINEL